MVSASLLYQHHDLRSGALRSSYAGFHSWTIYVRDWRASPSVRTGFISDLLSSWAKMTYAGPAGKMTASRVRTKQSQGTDVSIRSSESLFRSLQNIIFQMAT